MRSFRGPLFYHISRPFVNTLFAFLSRTRPIRLAIPSPFVKYFFPFFPFSSAFLYTYPGVSMPSICVVVRLVAGGQWRRAHKRAEPADWGYSRLCADARCSTG